MALVVAHMGHQKRAHYLETDTERILYLCHGARGKFTSG